MFAADVKEGKYNKLDYAKWRNLRDATPEEWDINIECQVSASEENPIKAIVGWNHCIAPYEFPVDGNSFGRFLYDLLKPYSDNPYSVDTVTVSNAMTEMTKSANSATASISSLQEAWDNLKMNYYDTTATAIGWDRAYPELRMEVRQDNFYVDNKPISQIIEEIVDNATGVTIRKENDSMNLFKNFDFGSCENDNVKMSMYGIAVKNANGTWVSYDAKSENVVDVDILNFDAKYLYKIPVAIKDVKVGDLVIHNRKPMFVTDVEAGKLLVIDPAAGEEKVVLLTRSPFGFDFVVKVVNLLGNFTNTATADAPFGNMLPLMMLADGKNDDILPLMFAMGGGNFDMSNPMMMYFLMKDGKSNDMFPLMFLMNSNKRNCDCDCDCDREG